MRLELRPRLSALLICSVCGLDRDSQRAASDRFKLVMEVMAGDVRWSRLSVYELCPCCGQRQYGVDTATRRRAWRHLRRQGLRACRRCKGLRRAFHVQGCDVGFAPGCSSCGGSGRVQATCTAAAS